MSKGLFVGLCGLDVVFYEQNKFPVEDTKMKCSDVRACIGGPAANAAITFSMLGGQSTVVSYIGTSAIGLVIKEQMKAYGIQVIDLCDDNDVKCISSIYVNTTNATRTIFSGRNGINKLSALEILEKKIAETDFILYDGHFPQVDDCLLESSKKYGKDIVIDVGDWKDTFNKILQYNPTLICSKVFNKNGRNGVQLMDDYRYDRVAITKGASPIEYKTSDMTTSQEIAVPKVDAKDTLGAGDIFHGAYCYFRYCENCDFKSALENASKVAAASTAVYGVVDGVKRYLQSK